MSISSQSEARWSGNNNRSYNRLSSQKLLENKRFPGHKKPLVDCNSIYPPFCRKLYSDVPIYVREGDVEYPFEDIDDIGDENKIRGNWSSRTDYLLSSLGFIFNLGNLWRFPYYCRTSGGGSFCVCYVLLMLIAGIPVVLMELTLGQFSSVGCITVWKAVPLFKGIGIAMFIITCIISVYYGTVCAWAISFFINSFKLTLPWATCANEWNSEMCSMWNRGSASSCIAHNGTFLQNGSCIIYKDESSLGINLTVFEISAFGINESVLPTTEFFHHELLMLSNGFDKVHSVNWQLALYLLVAWFAGFLCLFKGIKSSGKVVYVVVFAPYLIMFVLFVRFLTLPGSLAGLIYFFTPKWETMANYTVWSNAAVQVFLSMLCCTGGLSTLASYNKFHSNVFKDAWILCLADIITSLSCAALMFSAIGFLCYELEIPVDKFTIKGGVHLMFIYLPEAIAKLPVAPIYAVLYFVMIITVLLTTANVTVETVVSAICDEFPERLRRNHRHVLAFTCVAFYTLGVPLCTTAGLYWLLLLDHFASTWTLILLCFFECMAISWAYGVDNFLDNIKWMALFYPPPYIFWKILWKFVCPLLYLALLSFAFLAYKPLWYETYEFPHYAEKLGWALSLVPLLAIPITAAVKFCKAKGTFVEKWKDLLCPDDDWGPALAIHRSEYYPLQIPEARRLVLPSLTTIKESLDGYSLPAEGAEKEEVIKEKAKCQRISTTMPLFERETAI